MTACISYEDQQARFIIKAMSHYRKRIETNPLTPKDEIYPLTLAYGIFLPSKNLIRYVGRLLADIKRRNSDFGAITLYCVEGTNELSTKDLAELTNYATAVSVYLMDAVTDASIYRDMAGSFDALMALKNDLVKQLDQQVEMRKGDIIDSYVDQATLEGDPDQPTTWDYRFQMALALLCNNHLPDERLCRLWRDEEDEDAHEALQSWVLSHCALSWATGIGTIEAAMTLADTPDEGGKHED